MALAKYYYFRTSFARTTPHTHTHDIQNVKHSKYFEHEHIDCGGGCVRSKMVWNGHDFERPANVSWHSKRLFAYSIYIKKKTSLVNAMLCTITFRFNDIEIHALICKIWLLVYTMYMYRFEIDIIDNDCLFGQQIRRIWLLIFSIRFSNR